MDKDLSFNEFKKSATLSIEDICRDIFYKNPKSIKIKKEKVGVKNLVKIFNATLTLSNKKGFQSMSLRDLCQETGLSMGALYSYFSSKGELLHMIQSQGREIVFRILIDKIGSISHPVDKLERAIMIHLYLSELMKEWFFFSYMETRHFTIDEHKNAIASELFTEKIFLDILEEGKKQNFFSVGNTMLAASSIKAIIQDWYLKRWKYQRRNISVEEYGKFCIELVKSFIMGTKT